MGARSSKSLTGSSGIRCVFNSGVQQPGAGDRVTFNGTMATDAAGQRYINVTSVLADSGGIPVGALGAGAKSVNQAKPDMYGLLARAWGKVTYVSPDNMFYYINDGSSVTDSSGVAAGLRVQLGGLATSVTNIPAVGQYVTMTGVVSKAALQSGTSNVVVPVLQAIDCTVKILEPQFTIYYLNQYRNCRERS